MRYFFPLSLFTALLVATPSIAQKSDPGTYFSLLEQAETALDARDYEQAIVHYRPLAEQTPDNPELWTQVALAQYRLGQYDDALSTLVQLDALAYPFDGRWLFSGALLFAGQGNQEAALNWLERALARGYSNRPRLRREKAFADYHTLSRFRQLAGLPPENLTRTEAWRFDLAHFVEEAHRLHVDPEKPAHAPVFEEAVQRLHDQIPNLSDEQIVLDLMRLAALMGDGHTAVYGPGEETPLQMDGSTLPLKFYLFDEGLYIVDADEARQDLVGHRVVQIGSLRPEEILERLTEFRGVDNQMTMNWLGVQFYMPRLAMLRAVGAADTAGVTLTIENKLRHTREVRLAGTDWQARRKLRSPAVADTTLWLRHVDANYWLHTLPEGVYFQFNQVRDLSEGSSISDFAHMLRDTLQATAARDLILDLRHNNGGNNSLVRPLIRQLIGWEMAEEDHRLWVLTGRNTFSAAQNFLNQVERYTEAIIVGEPSSSSPNFLGEETDVELPWSRVRASISTHYWQDSAPTDHRQWIYPDIPITLSAADYFANRDPVLESVLQMIRQREQ